MNTTSCWQNAIAAHESNGIDIIIALILKDITPLGDRRMELVWELRNNASKLLLAIMESRLDSENAERILYNMTPRELVSWTIALCSKIFHISCFDESIVIAIVYWSGASYKYCCKVRRKLLYMAEKNISRKAFTLAVYKAEEL